MSRSPPPPPSSSSPSASSPSRLPISLDQPRPSSERHRNLYFGAPLHHSASASPNPAPSTHSVLLSRVSSSSPPLTHSNSNCTNLKGDSSSVTAAEQVRLKEKVVKVRVCSGGSDKCRTSSHDGVVVVTAQPRSLDQHLDQELEKGLESGPTEPSILCPVCRKCRCEACASPRPLPSAWLCSEKVHCGPESCLDYLSCLCCVKGLFYHCGNEPDDGVLCADKPCSCAPHKKFWRWGCMAGLSLCLPCLCLYWPCKGGLRLVEKGYQRWTSTGCRCQGKGSVPKSNRRLSPGNHQPEISSSSEDESTGQKPTNTKLLE